MKENTFLWPIAVLLNRLYGDEREKCTDLCTYLNTHLYRETPPRIVAFQCDDDV